MAEITSIILAAGEGKRLQSSLTKTLHPVCGLPMIEYPITAARAIGSKQVVVVVPPDKKHALVQYLKGHTKVALIPQSKPLGTGHAVLSAVAKLKMNGRKVLILNGDTPLVTPETLRLFLQKVGEENPKVGLITAKMKDPSGLGRILRDQNGKVLGIVEEKEADATIKKIHEINTGVFCADGDWLAKTLKTLKPHPFTGEYYITDIVEAALGAGESALGYCAADPDEFVGINTREQLSIANEKMRERLVRHWMGRGVTFLDPKQVYLEAGVTIGQDTVIYPQVYLHGKTKIGKDCVIECGAVLREMVVGNHVHVKPYCVMEESQIEDQTQIGPFARVRAGTLIGEGSRIGNFVELKKTKLGKGVKANHLSYLGDAEIGDGTNIGCGTITCNYDGVNKHPTKIGKNVFVGSDVQFVAPVKIGDETYIGAGSTITEDVPAKALAIARARQTNKKGWVKKRKK